MRRALAAAIDSASVAILAYVGFRLAVQVAPCNGDLGACPLLTPLIVALVLLALGLYFGLGQLVFRATPGERALGLAEKPTTGENSR